jgi:hypothetical protein
MKLLSKYELRERITGLPVEVFLAQELRTGLSRLVHLVDWAKGADEATSQEILKLICRWAPEPPGIILEVGRDETTSRAYLVTTLPADPLAVQAWVQAYERATASAVKAEPVPSVESPGFHESETASIPAFNPPISGGTKSGPETPGLEPPRSGTGDFTRAFRQAGPPPPAVPPGKIPAANVPVPKVSPPASGGQNLPGLRSADTPHTNPSDTNPGIRSETGDFTKEFLGVLGSARAGSAELPSKSPDPKLDTRPPGTFTREFFAVPDKPSVKTPPPKPQDPFPPGFAQESPKTEKPSIFPDLNIPSAKSGNSIRSKSNDTEVGSTAKAKTGEFTEFFRGVGGKREESPNAGFSGAPENIRADFDRSFRDDQSQPAKEAFGDKFFANSSKPAPGAFAGNSRAAEPFPAPDLGGNQGSPGQRFDSPGEFGGAGKSRNYAPLEQTLTPNLAPNFQQATSVPEPIWDREAGTSDATRVFAPPGGAPSPASFPVQEGPSEFTQILSRGNQPPPETPPKPAPKGARSDFKLPAMHVPPAPVIPGMQMPAVSAPSLAAPKIAAPKPPAAPKSTASYIPLIIVLNVVLLLAIALVLYFTLKPH